MTEIQRTPKIFAAILIGFIAIFIMYVAVVVKPKNLSLLVNPHAITPVTPLYLMKVGRENLQSLFIFGDIDTAGWELTLASKRLEEASVLKAHDLESLSQRQLKIAYDHQAKALAIIDAIRDQTDTNYLTSKYQENQQLLESLR